MSARVLSTVRLTRGLTARRRPRLLFPLPLLLLLLLPLLSGCTELGGDHATDKAFVQEEGEIFLEPAGNGRAGVLRRREVFVPVGPPPRSTSPPRPPWAPLRARHAPGGHHHGRRDRAGRLPQRRHPALYGGSKSKALVDKEGQLAFFEQNPDKAAAFCAALNADPTFKWSGGTQIQPSQLRDYFAELTPLMLTRDTRVTNHGYRNGKPTPRQSVLQAGQMVLVDRYGVPRVRCECGNPLTPPKPVKKTPRYTGPRWPDFDPTVIIVIQPTTVIIEIFVVIDIYTGQIFDRPPGTEGAEDVPTSPASGTSRWIWSGTTANLGASGSAPSAGRPILRLIRMAASSGPGRALGTPMGTSSPMTVRRKRSVPLPLMPASASPSAACLKPPSSGRR